MSKVKLYSFVSEKRNYIGIFNIIKEWERLGFVEIESLPINGLNFGRASRHIFTIWVGRVGGFALEPTPTRITHTKDPFEHAMVTEYISPIKIIPNAYPWNFWVRDLNAYDSVRMELSSIPKTVESIFSGTIRSEHARNKWINSTEIFGWRVASRYTRVNNLRASIKDYYKLLASAKFGLCPMGDTGFCQREIETMGLGVIPIFTPGTDPTYHEPLVEGEHYIYAETPEDMHEKIASMDDEKIKWMKQNVIDYYDRRISPIGMWNSVTETIEKYNINVG